MGIHSSFITKIPGDTLLTKMAAELPSTEQIFTETSRLVPLRSEAVFGTKGNRTGVMHNTTFKVSGPRNLFLSRSSPTKAQMITMLGIKANTT